MAATAVFDDMACSIPTKITFTPYFGCSAAQDSFSSVCGPGGPTHFIVSLNADGSGTITSYTDSYCSQLRDTVEVTKHMVTYYTCVQDNNGRSGCIEGTCSERYIVGGFGGPPAKELMTTLSVYDNPSCLQPATTMIFTRGLYCTPQLNPLEPVCDNVNGINSISDCEIYDAGGWDSSGLIHQAFCGHTYLTIEEYDISFGSCGHTDALVQATVYLLDEECHPNRDSTASTQLTFGRSLTISTYDNPYCTAPSSDMDVTWESTFYMDCIGGNTRAFLSSWPDLTAVAVFESLDCPGRPMKIQFTRTQLFGCNVAEDPIKSVCGLDGSSHSSISSSTRDYNGLATATFGSNTPYLMVKEFVDSSCSRLQNVTVYVADGSCHANTDDATSFMATITTNGSATITTYSDSNCTFVDHVISVNKRKLIDPSTCYPSYDCNDDGGLCSSRISYGGLGAFPSNGQLTSAIFHGADSSCSQPAEMVKYTRELVCTPQPDYWNPVCEDDGGLYYNFYCTTYSSMWWDNDRILPNTGGSVAIATYPTSPCNDYEADYITIGAKYISTGECIEGRLRLYANMTGILTPAKQNPPTTDIDYKAREEIMFPEWLWEPAPRRVFESS
ncbi:hypothetical protein ON010_g15985 [Phytophthora cinnamomi]|nr:hypothetical protein ON010_g15985 [Phytophthora cinnamomi]